MYQIAVWILHWTVQHLRYHMPYVSPWPENAGPPTWWYHFYSDWDWWRLIGSGNVPYITLIDMALRGSWQLIGLWVDEVGDWAVSSVRTTVREWIGYAASGMVTFSQWIWGISDLIGTYVPWWCTNLTNAADKLYAWLPYDVRTNVVTFYDKFVAWYNAANSWAATRFDDAKAWVANTAAWVVTWIEFLGSWYYAVGEWVTDFKANPGGTITGYLGTAWSWLDDFHDNYYARVTGWLGDPWSKLMAFTGGALTFFYNLYALYAAEIGAFWADPLMWLYDRAEAELVRRW